MIGIGRGADSCDAQGHDVFVSRGPTRRVRQLVTSGVVSEKLLAAADHEADLLAHPYTGIEHVELARLRLAGRTAEREALREQFGVGVRRRWWRPCGRQSALLDSHVYGQERDHIARVRPGVRTKRDPTGREPMRAVFTCCCSSTRENWPRQYLPQPIRWAVDPASLGCR